MPRFELRYRPAALADLEDVFRGVLRVSASPMVARRYVERIRARCRLILPVPPAGRAMISPPAYASCHSSAAP